jgi:hypothetical protein
MHNKNITFIFMGDAVASKDQRLVLLAKESLGLALSSMFQKSKPECMKGASP